MLSKLKKIVPGIGGFDGTDNGRIKVNKLIRFIQTAETAEAPILQEILRIHIAEFVFGSFVTGSVRFSNLFPELFVFIERLGENDLAMFIEFPAVSTEQKLRKIIEDVFMPVGESFMRVQTP